MIARPIGRIASAAKINPSYSPSGANVPPPLSNALFLGTTLCVCLSADHDHEPCKNGWNNRHAVWHVDSQGPEDACMKGAHLRRLADTVGRSVRAAVMGNS